MSISTRLFRVFAGMLHGGLSLLGRRPGAIAAARLAEQLAPLVTVETAAGPLRFYCPGHVAYWQAEHALTKEPETITWIDSFNTGDVFWDIGANVGVYALCAALRPGIRVLAFEPAAMNYYVLNRNIELNNQQHTVAALCLAFHERSCIDSFYMASSAYGEALHSFAASTDWQNQPFSARFEQTTLGFAIDDFIAQFDPPFPQHLKIDVDGNEARIISGAARTLADRRVRSLLVELNLDRAEQCASILAVLERAGFVLHTRAHAPMFDTGPFASVYNHIFVRH